MKILFLDIDGVLNTHDHNALAKSGRIHPDKVERLNYILQSTRAKIVLSSAWRYLLHRGECNLSGLQRLLSSHGVMADSLVSVTPPSEGRTGYWDGNPATWINEEDRGGDIAKWLRTTPLPVTQYAVVDDIDLKISLYGHPFVQTDWPKGLTNRNAEDLIKLLGRTENVTRPNFHGLRNLWLSWNRGFTSVCSR